MTQMLLFEESLEGKLLREVRELKESVTKIRKGQFAKYLPSAKYLRNIGNGVNVIINKRFYALSNFNSFTSHIMPRID